MESYAEHLFSSSSDGKRNSPFDPELFRTVSSEIQKSGDQEISKFLNVPVDESSEIVVEVLERFGRALKNFVFSGMGVVPEVAVGVKESFWKRETKNSKKKPAKSEAPPSDRRLPEVRSPAE